MYVSYWTCGSVELSAYQDWIPNVGSIIVRLYLFCALSPMQGPDPVPEGVASSCLNGKHDKEIVGVLPQQGSWEPAHEMS